VEQIYQLLDKIRYDTDCIVRPAITQPVVSEELVLPNDLKAFYENCGGIILFPGKSYSMEIVGPDSFLRANPIIVGEPCEYDITYNWFIIGKAGEQYVTIDLAPQRLGRCYDSFWDRHGVPGENPIIAKNFTALLEDLYNNRGEYWYWLQNNFISLGDAYEEVE
jgi:hypothetical protein